MPTHPFTVPALFDALPDPAALIDAEGCFLDLNPAFLERARRRGFAQVKEAWIGRLFWDTSLLRDPQGCETFVRRALAQGGAGARERFIYDLETEVHMELSLTPLLDPQGRVLGGLILWKNVTPQVRQEQRREIIPQVREAIWRMGSSNDVAGILVAVRNGLEKLGVPFANCGVNLVDATGHVFSHSMTEEGAWLPAKTDDPGNETVLRIWRSQELAYRRDLDREDRYGEAGWIKTDFNQPIRSVIDAPFSHGTLAINSTAPDAFDQEDLDALEAMARVLSEGFQRLEDFRLLEERNRELEREVAERRRAEETLQESEARIRRLMDDLPIGIALSTPEGRVFYSNPYNSQVLGYTPEDMPQVRAQDLYLHPEDREELVRNLRERGEHAFEYLFRRKDGQPVWMRGKTRAYRDPDGQVYYLGITEDIDQRRRQELRQQVFQQAREAIWRMEKPQDLERLLQAVQAGLRRLEIPFVYCGVNILDLGVDPPVVTIHTIHPDGRIDKAAAKAEDHPLLRIWRQREIAYRPDLHRADLYGEWEELRLSGVRSLVDAPFSHGTLALSSTAPDAFSAQDLQVLGEMAALLSEGFQRLADLQNLEYRAREAEALANAITAVAQTLVLEEVFQSVVREAARLTASERATLFLYDEQAGVLVPRAQVGHDWESYRHIRLRPGEDLSGQVFTSGQPRLYDRSHTPFSQTLRPENRAWLEQAVPHREGRGAAVPLRLENQVIGTLAMRSETHTFTQRDLELLARLAEQAALAIERTGHLQTLEREVAERRQAEAALRLAQFTIDNTSEAVFWFGPDGRFFYVNEAACRSLGYTREELTALHITDIDPDFPREPWEQSWQRIQRESQPRNLETHHRAKDGRLFPVEITATYLEFDGREFVCTFARDITARTQLESQLRQSQKMEAVGQLTAGIAHNFNNMLQVISGNLHLLHDQVPTALRDHLADAEQSASRAADMVRQLMIFARPAGAHRPQPFDLAALLRHILAICRQTFDQHLALEAQIAPQLPQVQGHTGQLEQVLLNLLINARDALEEAANPAPRIGAYLQLAAPGDLPADLPPGPYLLLQVSDNGVGMDAVTQARIFEPFFTTKPVGKGTGLGLATVYAIVREHRGRILCESRAGEGTTFSVLLPALGAPAPAETPAPESVPLPRGTETLLLIDDEKLVRRTLGQSLERAGYRVLEAEKGEEGLEILRREGRQVALVVLDLSMPGMSGAEVLEHLGRFEARPKVVLLTGYAADPAQYTTADEVLQKPLKLADLVRRVRQLLDG